MDGGQPARARLLARADRPVRRRRGGVDALCVHGDADGAPRSGAGVVVARSEGAFGQTHAGVREIAVNEVMTPRVVITAFQQDYTIRQVMDENQVIRFSRIPIFGDSIDDIKGIIIRSQLLMAASRDEWGLSISELSKPVKTISTNSSVDSALDMFLTNKQQIAIVTDEFGGTSGILTMEDVLETLLGEEIVERKRIPTETNILLKSGIIGVFFNATYQSIERY